MNDPNQEPDADLRRDVRLVTSMLGDTLKRAEGEELLALVERVRTLAKDDTLEELPELDLETTTRLARAFTAYFHLANVTEQVHRGRALLRARDGGASAEDEAADAETGTTRWIRGALARVLEAGIEPATIEEGIPHVAVRPVFTAHPTEVARRSTIEKMRQVAGLLEQPDSPRRTRRLEEAVEMLWRTDEIRVEPPQPIDEARNGVYYLEGLAAGALPRRPRGAARPAGRHRRGASGRRTAAALRQLDRRRPGRQPQRHAGDDT